MPFPPDSACCCQRLSVWDLSPDSQRGRSPPEDFTVSSLSSVRETVYGDYSVSAKYPNSTTPCRSGASVD